MGLTFRRVSGFYKDYHFDSGSKTQLTLSDFKGHVSLRIIGEEISIQNGVTVGMSFTELRKAIPDLTCESNDDAVGTFVLCKVSEKFSAIFPGSSKKFAGLPTPLKLNAFEKMLRKTKLSRLEAEIEAVPKPKDPTAKVRQKGVLPAGISYFRNAYTPCKNTKWSSLTCDIPSVAVVDGIYTEKAARDRLNSIGVGAQYPVGYPLVVHSDEIGFKDKNAKGVVIILGLFANGNAAKVWQLKTAPKAKVMTLLPPGQKSEDQLDISNKKRVVRIRPGASVNGYKGSPFKTEQEMTNPPDKMPEGVCKVAGGSFLVTAQNASYAQVPLPAKCKDGKDAFVHYNDTLVNAMVGPSRDATWKLWQLTYVECDGGYFSSWSMEGRSAGNKRTELENDDGC